MWWFWAVIAVVVAYGGMLGVRRYQRHHPPTDAPVNVRMVYNTGRVVPVELLYRGRWGHRHHWWAVTPIALNRGERIKIDADYMPAKTMLHGTCRVPVGMDVEFTEDP
jgi:hypothetical protein